MDNTITVAGCGSIHVVPDVTKLEVTEKGVFEIYGVSVVWNLKAL